MNHAAPPSRDPAIHRAASLLKAIAGSRGDIDLATQAQSLDIPLSTAYRIVSSLISHGLVAPAGRGRYGPGLALSSLARRADERRILSAAARPAVRRLARECRATAHLGILDSEMVTYLVKERGGGKNLFTCEGGQLEAYCSAIGKILLAHLPDEELQRYLASAPFVPLTSATVTDPASIQGMLKQVRQADRATDIREVHEDLICAAVPVRDATDRVVAAVSLSRTAAFEATLTTWLALEDCVRTIETNLGRNERVGA